MDSAPGSSQSLDSSLGTAQVLWEPQALFQRGLINPQELLMLHWELAGGPCRLWKGFSGRLHCRSKGRKGLAPPEPK